MSDTSGTTGSEPQKKKDDTDTPGPFGPVGTEPSRHKPKKDDKKRNDKNNFIGAVSGTLDQIVGYTISAINKPSGVTNGSPGLGIQFL